MRIPGTRWFRQLRKDAAKMSKYLKFVRIKEGYYRIYWVGGGEAAYIHECYAWMPYHGYHIEERDPQFASKRYYEEYEGQANLSLKIKNFVEGYHETKKALKIRVYMFKNSAEHRKQSIEGYRRMKVK